jgi:membrane protease subunit HflC
MKNVWALGLGILIIVLLGAYMITYQVAFDQVAVVTTLGRVSAVAHGDAGAGGLFGNLRLKWPAPIQTVYTFDARTRVISSQLERQQTLDKQAVIASVYVAWRIDRPEAFYTFTQGDIKRAERRLLANVRDAKSEIGNFTFDELTNTDPAKLRIAEVESAMQTKVQSDMPVDQFGMVIESVGLKRIELPQQVTEAVFERMKSTRQRLAQAAESEGEAAASRIRGEAESAKQRILAFANRRAQEIRAEGEAAAQAYYREFKKNEDFAIFLRELQSLEQTLKHNTTFLLDTEIEPFDVLITPPAAEGVTQSR